MCKMGQVKSTLLTSLSFDHLWIKWDYGDIILHYKDNSTVVIKQWSLNSFIVGETIGEGGDCGKADVMFEECYSYSAPAKVDPMMSDLHVYQE